MKKKFQYLKSDFSPIYLFFLLGMTGVSLFQLSKSHAVHVLYLNKAFYEVCKQSVLELRAYFHISTHLVGSEYYGLYNRIELIEVEQTFNNVINSYIELQSLIDAVLLAEYEMQNSAGILLLFFRIGITLMGTSANVTAGGILLSIFKNWSSVLLLLGLDVIQDQVMSRSNIRALMPIGDDMNIKSLIVIYDGDTVYNKIKEIKEINE